MALMLAQPSMIKAAGARFSAAKLLVGFKPDIYAKEVPAEGRENKG